MTPRILAARTAIANERLAAAASQLAQARDFPVDSLNAIHRDPAIQQLVRLEALVELMELMAATPEPKRTRREDKP